MKIIFLAFILLPTLCFSQIDSAGKLTISESLVNNLNKTAFEIYICALADSMNNLDEGQDLPDFLMNENFDNDNFFFWTKGNRKISMRYLIIARVVNCNSLKVLLNSPNRRYKKKPKKIYKIKYTELSFYELALKRKKDLMCGL